MKRTTRAIACLQRLWRARYLNRKHAASLKIQDWWTRHYHRRSRAATLIQKNWRGFWNQVCFQVALLDIVTVQSFIRSYLARRCIHKERDRKQVSVCCIQVRTIFSIWIVSNTRVLQSLFTELVQSTFGTCSEQDSCRQLDCQLLENIQM